MHIKRVKGHGRFATYEMLAGLHQSKHLKLRPSSYYESLKDESQRTNWANNYNIPAPVTTALRFPIISTLVSVTLEGSPSHKYIDLMDPVVIIRGISSALKKLQDMNVHDFPFSIPRWATEEGVEKNLQNLTSKKHRALHPDFSQLDLRNLRDIVDAGPGTQRPTLSHGDFCMPNVLLDSLGQVSGIVDLGGLHIGNDKLDPAIMSWTLQANMGERWADHFLEAQNTNAQDQGIVYSRLAYDLGLKRDNPWGWIESDKLLARRKRLSND